MPRAWVLARIAEEADRAEGAAEQLQAGWSLLWGLCTDLRRQAKALTEALAKVTHEFVPGEYGEPQWSEPRWCSHGWADGDVCGLSAQHLVHRTPAVVLSGLDAEATP